MTCGHCGLRWDIADPDPPQCRKAAVKIASIESINAAREAIEAYNTGKTRRKPLWAFELIKGVV